MRSERYRLGELELDAIGLELRRGDDPVGIRRLPLRLLVHLVRHRDRAVTKDELAEAFWPGIAVSDAALTSAVRDLRRALGEERSAWIETRRGCGYRFVGPVEEAAAQAAAPTPAQGDDEPFVGRDDVIAALDGYLDRAQAGRGVLVLIAGEAGIGKTRVTDMLARRAEARGFDVLFGRCLETGGAPPFWPWIQVLRAHFARRSPAVLRKELGVGALDLARVLPELAERLPGLGSPPALEARLARFRFLDAAAGLLMRTPERPRLLVLEDLHRADAPSLELLDHLRSNLADTRLLVVGTYRDTELGRDPILATLLGRIGRNSETELLVGLDRDDVARYCEMELGAAPDDAIVDALSDRSGGNPFLLKLLVALRRRRGQTSDSANLPNGLAETVMAQLEPLAPEERDLLRMAAIFGREFAPALLARLAELPLELVLSRLHRAAEQRIVTRDDPAGPHRFVHALVAEVLYSRQSVGERLALHGRAGLALEAVLGSEGEHVAELAHHYGGAAPAGFGERAVAACRRAAERAGRELAYEESARLWERALAVLEKMGARNTERLALLLEAGEAWSRHGSLDKARQRFAQALDLARSLGDAQAHGRAALGFCLDEDPGVPVPEWIEALQEAAQVVRDQGPLRARILARLGYAIWWAEPRSRARDLLREAISLAQRVGEPDTLAWVLSRAHFVFHAPGQLEERLVVGRELQRLASSLGDEALLTEAAVAGAWDALVLGERADLDTAIRRLDEVAHRLRRPLAAWWAHTFRGSRAALVGAFEEADAAWMEARRIGEEAGSPFRSRIFLNQIPPLRLDQGRSDEAREMSEGMVRLSPHPQAQCAALLAAAACGDPEPARALLESQWRGGFPAMPDDVSWYNISSLLAEVCREVGSPDAAAALYERLLPVRREHFVLVAGWVYRGSVERHLGLLAGAAGKADAAIGHFEQGLASERALGALPSLATGLLDYGRLLLGHDDAAGARERLEEAREIAAKLGMRRLEAEAKRLLSAGS